MPPLPLTVANYGRPRVGLPTTRLVNAYIEATKGGPTQAARIPRAGFATAYTLSGSGPILRLYQQPGLFNGDLFTLTSGHLYRNSTDLGAIPYGLNPRMAAAQGKLAIVTGGALYVYDGSTLSLVQYFDDGSSPLPSFSGVAVLYNIFVYPVAGTDQFFFSSVGDPATINAANFGSAQTNPDSIVEVQVLAEELLFFGDTSVEFWDYTGSLTAPFALSQGRTYIRGCAAQGSVVKLDNAMFWVADDYSVYRSSAVPLKVSTPFIDDRLRHAGDGVSQCLSFTYNLEGHAFYVLNIPSIGESYAYDCQTQEWAQWGTQESFDAEPGLFAASCAAGQGDAIFLGSATDPVVWLVDPTSNVDGTSPKRVVVSGAIWKPSEKQRCNNIALACVRGVGNSSAPDPIVEMRFSDDGGRAWTSWLQGHLGFRGEYDYKAVWWGLGTMSQPGRLFEFAVSDPVYFVVEGATFNEPRP